MTTTTTDKRQVTGIIKSISQPDGGYVLVEFLQDKLKYPVKHRFLPTAVAGFKLGELVVITLQKGKLKPAAQVGSVALNDYYWDSVGIAYEHEPKSPGHPIAAPPQQQESEHYWPDGPAPATTKPAPQPAASDVAKLEQALKDAQDLPEVVDPTRTSIERQKALAEAVAWAGHQVTSGATVTDKDVRAKAAYFLNFIETGEA